jgi:hypothetical protein
MAELFGFSIKEKAMKPRNVVSPVPPNNDDGSAIAAVGGHYGYYVDMEGRTKTDFDLIRRYREMSLHPECDYIIDDIANEAIVSDQDDIPVEIELSNLKVSESLKKKIREEFQQVIRLLDFENKGHSIFRRWYIDGRLFYHKLIDFNDPSKGIIELRYIDPLKIKKITEIRKSEKGSDFYSIDYGKTTEYFVYNAKGINLNDYTGIKIAPDAITYVTSGMTDPNRNIVLSYLHKAIKILNQLRMVEDTLVIYRMARAPERRIFYIDVGNLPKVKAEQYLREVMTRYRQKLVYDSNTGEIRDDRKHMSMLEDFWLPRREGGRGTEITTLPGGQNLGQLEDVKYFEKKMYEALNVPASRLEKEGSTFNFGTNSQILRDELKFSRFVGRLRKKFSELFGDLLKTQLILKGIVTPEDWETMRNQIQYDYKEDNHYTELKDLEVLTNRMNILAQLQPYIGLYYSNEYIRRQILKQTDAEILEIHQQIEQERKQDSIPDMTEADYLSVINGFPTAPMPEMPEGAGIPMGGNTPQKPANSQSQSKTQQNKNK